MRPPLSEIDVNTPGPSRRSTRIEGARARAAEDASSPAVDEGVGVVDSSERRRRLSAAAVFWGESAEKTPDRTSPDYVTAEQAAARFGYESSCVRQDVRRKVQQQQARAQKQGESLASQALRQLREETQEETAGTSETAEIVAEQLDFLNVGSQGAGRVGNSGRKRLTEAEKKAREEARYLINGCKDFETYSENVVEAAAEVCNAEIGQKSATARAVIAEKLTFQGNALITAKHLCALARDEHLEVVRRRGGALLTPHEERVIGDYLRHKRLHYMAVRPRDAIEKATELLRLCPQRHNLIGDAGVTYGWWPGFASRNGFSVGPMQSIEYQRIRWTTSANAHAFYDILEEVCVKQGVAVVDPDYDAGRIGSSRLIWLHPELVISMDETDCGLSKEATKRSSQRGVRAGANDRGEVLHSKGLPPVSVAFSRNGAGEMVAPMVVVGGRKTLPDGFPTPDLIGGRSELPTSGNRNELLGTICDEDGKPLPTIWVASPKSAMNGELLLRWIAETAIPSLKLRGLSDESGPGGVIIVDGVQTHCSLEAALLCKSNNVALILRPPYTSSKLQGEDTTIFRYVSPTYPFIFVKNSPFPQLAEE